MHLPVFTHLRRVQERQVGQAAQGECGATYPPPPTPFSPYFLQRKQKIARAALDVAWVQE